ncbi:MAG: hypothetical protein QXG48_03970 [Thermofilaceae archaeon]
MSVELVSSIFFLAVYEINRGVSAITPINVSRNVWPSTEFLAKLSQYS